MIRLEMNGIVRVLPYKEFQEILLKEECWLSADKTRIEGMDVSIEIKLDTVH